MLTLQKHKNHSTYSSGCNLTINLHNNHEPNKNNIITTMPSKPHQTALAYLNGFTTLSTPTFLSLLTPTATHRIAPSSTGAPPLMNTTQFANHIDHLRQILSGFPVTPKEIFSSDESSNKVTVWATSVANFRDEVKDDGISDEEWGYRGEYIFVLSLDESRERVQDVLEFVDSLGTERLRGLMRRARGNLERIKKV